MKILVTGGAGFIGSHVVDLLLKNNHEVVVIDNLSSGKKENLNSKAKFYLCDLGNFEKVSEIFEKECFEIVYHLAAQINVRTSLENPVEDAKINIINSISLLELCTRHKIKHFIFSSTGGAIYGDTKDIPTTEKTREFPLSPYGCAKLGVENYLKFYNKVHGLKFTCLRYSNVYGPRQNSKGEAGVISIFFEKMFSDENPVIFGGIQTRDFVYVKDVARANLLALNNAKSSIYNVSSGKETDIIHIFSKINRFFKNKFEALYEPEKEGEPKRSCLSFEKINNNLGWVPETDLDDGLNQVYLWYLMKDKKK